jgi:hypothetical protein
MNLNGPVLAQGAPEEFSMSLYVVRFMKNVLGDNGHEIEACQGTLEVDATTEGQALELAKRRFCEAQSLCDWSLHADRVQVNSADFPS